MGRRDVRGTRRGREGEREQREKKREGRRKRKKEGRRKEEMVNNNRISLLQFSLQSCSPLLVCLHLLLASAKRLHQARLRLADFREERPRICKLSGAEEADIFIQARK